MILKTISIYIYVVEFLETFVMIFLFRSPFFLLGFLFDALWVTHNEQQQTDEYIPSQYRISTAIYMCERSNKKIYLYKMLVAGWIMG